jgi:hypothetical protein
MLLIGALVGALWFGAFVVLHVAVSTKRPVTARSRLLLRLFTPACAGTLLSAAVVPLDIIPGIAPTSHRAVALLAALVVIASGFVLYAPLYYTIVSSISVQTLIAIDAASNRRVRLDVLASLNVYDQIVSGRLASMVMSGALVRNGDRYQASRKGLAIVRSFTVLKHLWCLEPGG